MFVTLLEEGVLGSPQHYRNIAVFIYGGGSIIILKLGFIMLVAQPSTVKTPIGPVSFETNIIVE